MSITAAAIGAGSQLIGGLANIFSTRKENQRSQTFHKEMYNKQYKDAVDFWNMQNEYNDPSNQMLRLKKAGLNPMLMYGKGPGAGAAGQAGKMPSTPTPGNPQFTPQDFSGVANTVNTYFDTRIKQAQSDNLRTIAEQNQSTTPVVREQNKILMEPYVDKYGSYSDTGVRYKTTVGLDLAGYQAAVKAEEVRSRQIDNKAEEAYKYLIHQQTYDNLRKDGRLKDAELFYKWVIRPAAVGLAAKGLRFIPKRFRKK